MNTLDHYHDFYYLEALVADLGMAKSANPELEFSKAFEKLYDDVTEYKAKFDNLFAEAVAAYLWAAALGEARHASCMTYEWKLENLDGTSRSFVYTSAKKYPMTPENVEKIVTVFEQEWDRGYGGEPWLNIIKAIQYYKDGTFTPAAFLDHAADLEHNGGSAFNKGAGEKMNFDNENYHTLNSFLNYKFVKDILRKCWNYEKVGVSFKVAQLVRRHNNIIDREIVTTWLRPVLENIRETEIQWGNMKIELEENDRERNYCDYHEDETRHETTYIDNIGQVCISCLHESFTICEDCGGWTHDEKIVNIDDGCYCRSCAKDIEYSCCSYCGDNATDYIVTHDGETYCRSCEKHTDYCSEHEIYYTEDECPECETNEEEAIADISQLAEEVTREYALHETNYITKNTLKHLTVFGWANKGLILFREQQANRHAPNDQYTVTHMDSGRMVFKGKIGTALTFYSLAQASDIDWTQPEQTDYWYNKKRQIQAMKERVNGEE